MAGACLDENQVALLLDGALPEEERAAAGAHLEGCEACRKLVGASAQALDEEAGDPARAPAAQPPARKPLERGESVGRYLVLDRVASGGMGSVYAAWDPQLDRKVALKLLHPHLGAAEALIQREAQAMARLSHPNVVAVHDVGHHRDRLFVAMEFVEGVTLRQRLRAQRPGWREVVALFREAGRGLQAAHEAGVVHGDFKPQNVLVGGDGRVRVTDFGLARALPGARWAPPGDGLQLRSPPSPGPPLPTPPVSPPPGAPVVSPPLFSPPTGGPAGTPAYMAPEQFDAGAIDARTDLFSFCAALFEALHGKLPFEGTTAAAIVQSIRAGAVRPGGDPAVPGWLDQLVRRGLRADPAARPQSMAGLLAGLERDPAALRRRRLAAAGLLVLAVAAALAIARRPDPLQPCREGRSRLAGIWDPARRAEIEQAFAATRLAYSADAVQRVADSFDRWAGAWVAGWSAACAAGVREQQDPAVWLRLACYQESLAAAQAKSELFAHADPKLVEDAAAMASAMDDPSRCARGQAPGLPPPPEPPLRPAVERLRERLARVRSQLEAGRYAEAAAAAPEALAAARAIGWKPLEAEALLLGSEARSETGQQAAGLDGAIDAALLAEGARHDEVAAHAWLLACRLSGEQLARFGQARELARHARAAIERLGGDDQLLARLEDVEGMRHTRAGELQESLAALSSARAHQERTGRQDRFATWLLNDQASVLDLLGRYQEAAALLARAVELKERLLGPRHPDLGISLNNLGTALTSLGRLDEAEAALARARSIFAASLAPDHYLFVALETNFGDLARARGRLEEARGRYQRALDVGERSGLGDHQNLHDAASGLARTLTALGRPAEAVPLLERVMPLATAGVDPIDLANLRFALAEALQAACRERSRARALAGQARDLYRSTGRRGTSTLDEVEEWLRRNP